ncbi:type I DNA topoisomerase [Myxosarcina sp. GI1]|uniref:type I DNA topoisomerase n=1 Tax=Myxosarcina sp. GI1 TaxID=1541065 RepID=UPI000907C868|nr:type I DNA topoisomerase [Myxosarcina sp. GI1]
MNKLVIIESTGKLKKISEFLPAEGWTVMASKGHVRQLAHDGEDNLGFDIVGNRVNCRYQLTDSKAKRTVAELKKAVRAAEIVYLATDPDREGETISWHLAQILNLHNPRRISFNEISQKAISSAVANYRDIDMNLVEAGLARACFDKCVGYKGSPLLWAQNIGAKSMGRVQSAVLHLVCELEREIINFKPVDYFSVFVDYAEGFRAFYCGGSATEKENDNSSESKRIFQQDEAANLVRLATSTQHSLVNLERTKVAKKPPPPFTTSTLQQTAGAKLGFSPERTMQLAQTLYEQGYITYMRTDSVNLSDDFCTAARNWLTTKDPNNIPDKVTKHRNTKNAQEGHEAIRPTNIELPSSRLKTLIEADAFNLYVLIWKRSLASQCRSAVLNKTTVVSKCQETFWQAKGQTVSFLGYARYWHDLSAELELPDLAEGQILNPDNAQFEKKRTNPPSRLSEPQLVALMEKKGIGRPSTYSASVATLKIRQYVRLSKKKLFPTELGMRVNIFLQKFFPELIDAGYTSLMESDLDKVASGELNWQKHFANWYHTYFAPAIARARQQLPNFTAPKAQGKISATKYFCPVCQKPLEEYTYTKEGKNKSLLRCSDPEARKQPNHKQAVYFFSTKANKFWSPKFGELGSNSSSNAKSLPTKPIKKARIVKKCDRTNTKIAKIRRKK